MRISLSCLRMKELFSVYAVITLLIVLIPSCTCMAQLAGTGSIQGTVTDSTGAVIPGASVTITNDATQVTQNSVSNSQGLYTFPNIHIGTYTLRVTSNGFQRYRQTGIVLEVGRSIAINPILTVGTYNQQIEVQANGL